MPTAKQHMDNEVGNRAATRNGRPLHRCAEISIMRSPRSNKTAELRFSSQNLAFSAIRYIIGNIRRLK